MVTHDTDTGPDTGRGPPPWETVRIAATDMMLGRESTMTLADGRTLRFDEDRPVRVADPHPEAWRRWNMLRKEAVAGQTIRIRTDGDRLEAVAKALMHHPDDFAIIAALDPGLAAMLPDALDHCIWCTEESEVHDVKLPPHVRVKGNLLTACIEIDCRTHYANGEVKLKARLPGTMLAAVVGRPLRDIIRIDRLDALNPVIRHARQQLNTATDVWELTLTLVSRKGRIPLKRGG